MGAFIFDPRFAHDAAATIKQGKEQGEKIGALYNTVFINHINKK